MKQNAKFYAGSPRLAACSWGLCWEVKIWYRFDWHKPARLTRRFRTIENAEIFVSDFNYGTDLHGA